MRLKLSFFVLALSAATIFSSFIVDKDYTKTIILPDSWHKYTSEDGKMSISFPSKPEESVTDNEMITTIKLSSEYNQKTYFVGLTTHKNSLEEESPQELARVSLDAFTESTKGAITSESVFKYKKNEGLQADIKLDGGYLKYKVILIGQHQYQLVVISENDNFGKDTEKFFKSFKVN